MAFKKPREYFDTTPRPSHVTFDDGKSQKRNFPWMHYVEARWDYAEPDTIKVMIGDCVVVIAGHNLTALFVAIEDHALTRVRAQPELERSGEHVADSFATDIRFLKSNDSSKRKGQTELDLGLG